MLNDIERLRAQGLFRALRSFDWRRILNFCSNDYLGLAEDPRVVEATIDVVRRFGAGSGSARLISGNFSLCEELESGLAAFKGTESALLFNSGYHANIGAIPALAGEGDVIFSDELNHASLIDGCRLSKAEKVVYRHNDLNQLEEMLRRGAVLAPGRENPAPTKKIIVTEAVFSMEGDLCPLNDLLTIAEKYDATVYLDEAHAVGVFGEEGEGLAPKNPPERLICMGTLGKAFGSYGAFVAGSKTVRDYLINKARSFIFSTALPPAAVGASLAALQIIRDEPERRRRLWENVHRVGANLCVRPKEGRHAGLPLQSPIVSIPIGDAKKTMEISERLLDEGIYLQGIRPPTVPEGTSRLRLTVSATHTEGQIQKLLSALADVGISI